MYIKHSKNTDDSDGTERQFGTQQRGKKSKRRQSERVKRKQAGVVLLLHGGVIDSRWEKKHGLPGKKKSKFRGK